MAEALHFHFTLLWQQVFRGGGGGERGSNRCLSPYLETVCILHCCSVVLMRQENGGEKKFRLRGHLGRENRPNLASTAVLF